MGEALVIWVRLMALKAVFLGTAVPLYQYLFSSLLDNGIELRVGSFSSFSELQESLPE